MGIQRRGLQFLCPSSTWMTRMSTFCSSRCVAKLWRSVCIETRLSMRAARRLHARRGSADGY